MRGSARWSALMAPSPEDGPGPRDTHAHCRALACARPRACARSSDFFDITNGWESASCAAGAHERPSELSHLDWLAARVPGTAAGVLRDAGAYEPGDARDFDAEDWWFRTSFDAHAPAGGEEAILHL